MQGRARILTPISTFAEYCAEDDERKQSALVSKLKYRSGGGGVGPIMRFRQIVSTASHPGRDIATVEDDLEALIERSIKVGERERLTQISRAFIGQWRTYDYQFKPVQGAKVNLGRLTIKVFPDLGVVTRSGDEIAVRLWLKEREILDKERNTFAFLMSEAKQPAQWPADWGFGVWELEHDRINPSTTITDELRKSTYEKAERFAEEWDALPDKQNPTLRNIPVEQGMFDGILDTDRGTSAIQEP